jgi:hypothetical protein
MRMRGIFVVETMMIPRKLKMTDGTALSLLLPASTNRIPLEEKRNVDLDKARRLIPGNMMT